jgi:hypothetical protein
VLLAGDIRATLPEGRTVDCLQKIYPIGFNVIGGFAGSVAIGFDILALLTAQLALSPKGSRWELRAITATWLPRIIRHRFTLHEERFRRLGASFLIGSVSPGRNINRIFPETNLYAFRSESGFQAEEVVPGDAGSIGNGRVLEDPARHAIKEMDFQLIWNSGPRLHAFILAEQLRKRVREQPIEGVSARMVMGWAVRGDQGVEPWTTRGVTENENVTRPIKLARSLREFCALAGTEGAEATC